MFAPESGFYYEGCIGGKTGTTVAAGHTLVTGVTRDNTTYIAVTMRGTELSNSCMDSTAMFNYAFENFTKTEVNGGYVFLPKGVELNSRRGSQRIPTGKRNQLLFRRLSDRYCKCCTGNRYTCTGTDRCSRRQSGSGHFRNGSFHRSSKGR